MPYRMMKFLRKPILKSFSLFEKKGGRKRGKRKNKNIFPKLNRKEVDEDAISNDETLEKADS